MTKAILTFPTNNNYQQIKVIPNTPYVFTINVVIKLVYTSTNGSNGGSCKASPKSGGDMFSRLILCESLLKTLGVVSGGDV